MLAYRDAIEARDDVAKWKLHITGEEVKE